MEGHYHFFAKILILDINIVGINLAKAGQRHVRRINLKDGIKFPTRITVKNEETRKLVLPWSSKLSKRSVGQWGNGQRSGGIPPGRAGDSAGNRRKMRFPPTAERRDAQVDIDGGATTRRWTNGWTTRMSHGLVPEIKLDLWMCERKCISVGPKFNFQLQTQFLPHSQLYLKPIALNTPTYLSIPENKKFFKG